MNDYQWFEEFHPLKGEVPEDPRIPLDEIVSRARSFLKKRNKQQIINAAQLIEPIDLKVYKDISPGPNRSVALHHYFQELESKKSRKFPDARISDYFAVLSLMNVSQCLSLLKDDKPAFYSCASEFALRAMEAVCYAELMSKNPQAKAKEKHRAKKRVAALKKNAPNIKLREQIRAHYLSPKQKTEIKSQYATELLKKCPVEIDNDLFRIVNPQHLTITRWLHGIEKN